MTRRRRAHRQGGGGPPAAARSCPPQPPSSSAGARAPPVGSTRRLQPLPPSPRTALWEGGGAAVPGRRGGGPVASPFRARCASRPASSPGAPGGPQPEHPPTIKLPRQPPAVSRPHSARRNAAIRCRGLGRRRKLLLCLRSPGDTRYHPQPSPFPPCRLRVGNSALLVALKGHKELP